MIRKTRTYRAVADAFHYCRIIADENQICEFTRFLMRHNIIADADANYFANVIKHMAEEKAADLERLIYADTDSIIVLPPKD